MSRRWARRIALQALFQIDLGEIDPETALDYLKKEREIDEEDYVFACSLVKGTVEKLDVVDSCIREHCESWSVERMAAVERNVLRLAIYEILCCNDIPVKVSINEAIELARLFGEETSGSFVNGILDAVVKGKVKDSLSGKL